MRMRKALYFLALVEPAFLSGANVDGKHGSDLRLEISDGVAS